MKPPEKDRYAQTLQACNQLLRAQIACCTPIVATPDPGLEDVLVNMFREEWRLARGEAPLLSRSLTAHCHSKRF